MTIEQPTPSQIAEWKTEYGEVFSVEIRGQSFVFRALNFKELFYISSSTSTASVVDLEDYCLQHGLLYPSIEEAEKLAAGSYSSLAQEIREVSGLGDAKGAIKILDDARIAANNVINYAKIYILSTMPSYKEEDLDDLTATQLFHKVALAEKIIELQQQAFTGSQLLFTIIDPEEEAKKTEAEERKLKERMDRFAKQGGHYDKDKAPPVRPKIKGDDPIAAKLRGKG